MRPTNLWSGLTAQGAAWEASSLLPVPLPSTQTPAGSDHQNHLGKLRAVLTVLPNFSGKQGWVRYTACIL